NHHLEVASVDLTQGLLVHDRVVDGAELLDVVGRVVFGAADDVFLEADGERGGHAAGVVHVLAVRLLRAAPVGVPDDVHAGGEQHVVLRGRGLVADGAADALLEIEVPRSSAQRRGREHRGEVAGGVVAVVLTGVEVHAATGVAVSVAADHADARNLDVRAALDVAIIALRAVDAHHLLGLVFWTHGRQRALDLSCHVVRHAVGLHRFWVVLLRRGALAIELRALGGKRAVGDGAAASRAAAATAGVAGVVARGADTGLRRLVG